MRTRERERLRKSIERGAEFAVFDLLGDEDWWSNGHGHAWQGPEVIEECRAVYETVCKALGVKPRRG